MTTAFSIAAAQTASDDLDKILGELDNLFGQEDTEYGRLRADWMVDAAAEGMDINHDLLKQAKAEALECVTAVRRVINEQMSRAGDAMSAAQKAVNQATNA
ncbi:MAG: hypothetical protein Q4G64_05555 [bacterium]|nr:hypothetical protein [bacterium]